MMRSGSRCVRCRARARLALVVVVVVAACARSGPSQAPVIDHAAEPQWRAKLLAERAAHDREYRTDVTSPLAGVARFAQTATAYAAIDGGEVRLDPAPGSSTVVTFEHDERGDLWTWRPVNDALTATAADGVRAIAPGPITEPTLIRVSTRHALRAQRVDRELVVTAFDAQRPELAAFTGVPYFAPDPRFVVRALLERAATPAPVELATSRGLHKPFVEVGTLRFELDGARQALAAYRPAGSSSRELFVPFVDATSGKTSYGAARFLDLDEPTDPAAPVIVDFNRAYNPLCAFSPAYNCPLPPARNHLAIAIEAGERDPHLH